MEIRKFKKICIFLLIIFLIFNPVVLLDFSNNEKIEKQIKTSKYNKTKALDQEGENYRLVTSADNVQVPVPKGYVASSITEENYVSPEYSHTTISHKVSSTPTVLTWSSPAGEEYPWTQDENGIWISGNQGIEYSESVLESEEFDYIKGTTLTIKYTYSSGDMNYLNIDMINVTNNTRKRIWGNISGNTKSSFDYMTETDICTINDFATGRYKIRATYQKSYTTDEEGLDSGYIKGATYYQEDENGTQSFEEDIKTKIHDGGFVIYQLTDEELETNPNGTSVIIDDTNKDTAQKERNQYVWVPVPNAEDLVRTKMANNGIMQFGQAYVFSNTSITKETNTGINYYKEPRLVENYDKTKYYLQRYSNQDKRENYLNEQQIEFKNMLKSIEKYKGFYIGRYETGDEISHSSSNECYKNPKIVRYNNNMNYLTWYDSYKDLERLARKTQRYVETGMLYDTMWEYTLKWLNETDTRNYYEIYTNSGTWGNYSNNYKTVKSENGNIYTIGTEDITTVWDVSRTPTGSIESIVYKGELYENSPTSSNNIFDLAGNVPEWTMSRTSNLSRKAAGGDYFNHEKVTSYSSTNPFNNKVRKQYRCQYSRNAFNKIRKFNKFSYKQIIKKKLK